MQQQWIIISIMIIFCCVMIECKVFDPSKMMTMDEFLAQQSQEEEKQQGVEPKLDLSQLEERLEQLEMSKARFADFLSRNKQEFSDTDQIDADSFPRLLSTPVNVTRPPTISFFGVAHFLDTHCQCESTPMDLYMLREALFLHSQSPQKVGCLLECFNAQTPLVQHYNATNHHVTLHRSDILDRMVVSNAVPILFFAHQRADTYLPYMLDFLARSHRINETMIVCSLDGLANEKVISRLYTSFNGVPIKYLVHPYGYDVQHNLLNDQFSLMPSHFFSLKMHWIWAHAQVFQRIVPFATEVAYLEDDMFVTSDFYQTLLLAREIRKHLPVSLMLYGTLMNGDRIKSKRYPMYFEPSRLMFALDAHNNLPQGSVLTRQAFNALNGSAFCTSIFEDWDVTFQHMIINHNMMPQLFLVSGAPKVIHAGWCGGLHWHVESDQRYLRKFNGDLKQLEQEYCNMEKEVSRFEHFNFVMNEIRIQQQFDIDREIAQLQQNKDVDTALSRVLVDHRAAHTKLFINELLMKSESMNLDKLVRAGMTFPNGTIRTLQPQNWRGKNDNTFWKDQPNLVQTCKNQFVTKDEVDFDETLFVDCQKHYFDHLITEIREIN
mmetsp:Transcript_3946/g.5912  ORF Transcript_3946/g.5912 Transcript_3946/m.5912 type:complete len:605 (-) Transcript_3946:8-1822(-)